MTRVGIYFAAVQFLFVSCWTVYVIFLPQLAAQAGIEKKWVIYILMADQAIFTLMDFSLGVAADRVDGRRRRPSACIAASKTRKHCSWCTGSSNSLTNCL